MSREVYTTEQVIQAIQGTRGIKTTIARKLGCARITVDRYIKRHPTVKQAYDEEVAVIKDTAESQFVKMIQDGFWPAVKLALANYSGITDKLTIEGNLNLHVINEAIKALQDIGEDPQEVFAELVKAAKERARADID